MSGLPFDAVDAVLLVPILSAGLLALLSDYQLAARINVGAAFLTLVAALSLFMSRHRH
jgi:hydrogenase-4 component F